MKNGSIALLWKEQDAKKTKDINNPSADDHILDPYSVGAFKAVGLMLLNHNIYFTRAEIKKTAT